MCRLICGSDRLSRSASYHEVTNARVKAMRINRPSMIAALVLLAAVSVTPLRAQYDPIFDFIPLGGRSLLAQVFEKQAPAAEVKALLTGKRTREQWLAYLKGRTASLPGLQDLDDRQLLTLADYLSFNMPLPAAKVPADPAKADWQKVLPHDGRDLALEYCQSCHIITVVVTQDRPADHWLGTMHKPSHIEIELTEKQREALANYLVINAGIPIDDIPEELRAGGASY
jgi:mono/diheme cytochrome c family protein